MVSVGIWLESWTQPAWRARALRLLRARPDVQVAYVRLGARSAATGPRPNGLLRRLLRRDHHRATRFCRDAFAREDVRSLFADVPVGSAPAAPVAVDVLIQLGRAAPAEADRAAARLGLWRFDADPGELLEELPVGFWEVIDGRETLTTVLRAQTRAIHHRVGATALGSVVLTAMQALWRQSGDLAIKLGQLASLGSQALVDAQPPQAQARGVPGLVRTAALWTKLAVRVARRWAALRGRQYQWHLLAAPSAGDPRGEFNIARYAAIVPPVDRLWADPFAVVHEGRTFVFVEEQRFDERFGHVSVTEVSADRHHATPRTVLERPYHLSYPFVFRWADQWFLLPESLEAGRLELLRAVDFPYRWETDRILLDDAVADATLAHIDGQWWMFAARWPAENLDCDELHLYRAPSPLGPWTPHPRNPVRCDVTRSRPAGRFVFHDGSWWWPVQDGAKRYGYAVRWHRIVRLDDAGLEDEPGPVLQPGGSGGLLGVHTMNVAGAVCFADGLHLIPLR
jgi:hypothetical protein